MRQIGRVSASALISIPLVMTCEHGRKIENHFIMEEVDFFSIFKWHLAPQAVPDTFLSTHTYTANFEQNEHKHVQYVSSGDHVEVVCKVENHNALCLKPSQ